MVKNLHEVVLKLSLLLITLISTSSLAQVSTVFSNDFATSAGSTYSTATGLIGSNTTWSLLRGGADFGAAIANGRLQLTNDATGAGNVNNWALAYTTSQALPYSTILNQNAGVVTWTFNMRQSRSNPNGLTSGAYGNAFILAGTSNTTATTGSGYAIVLGQSGKTDRLRLVRYTAGVRTSTDLLTSNTSGLSDFGNHYISVKVTYVPSTNTWQLFVRNDGSAFQDPALGTLTSQGTVVNNSSTATALPLMGAFWSASTRSNQTAYFDNVKITIATPAIASISPTSKVAGSAAFTLTVNGTNFINGTTVRWNGVNRTTTYVSPTQLTVSIPATDITTAGTASITAATASAVSNAVLFTIDPANTPSISTSASALSQFSTTTGTASASQSFTSTGSSLTGNITVTAPANFEVALSGNGTYSSSVSVTAATTSIFVRVKNNAPAAIYSNAVTLSTPGGASKQVAVSAIVYSAEPTTSSTSVTFTNKTSISATVNWISGNGTNRIVVVRSGSAVNATPVDGISYDASANFSSGSEIGTGNYVAYIGTGNSFSLTGLTAATTYHVSVYEFNGAGGTENYRLTNPATGNTTTLNAPVGWQITAVDTQFKINFDTTVEGVNNGTYDGGGYSPIPEVGELNSNTFVTTPYTTTGVTFGVESDENSPEYGNGITEGNVTEGGYYSFEITPGNHSFGFQPSIEGYGTGSTTLRMQNQTNTNITSLNVGYTTYVYNDESGINAYSFSYSADNSTYTSASVFEMSSTAGADPAPGWKAHNRVITLSGLNVAPGAYYYIRWNSQNVSGTAFDEMAVDDIMVVANPVNQFVAFDGNVETFVLAGNAKLSGNITVNKTIAFVNGKIIIGANTLTLNGTVTNATIGGIRGGAASNLVVGGALNNTLSFDQTTIGTTNLFNNLSIATTASNTVTTANNVVINGTLFVETGQTFNLGTNTLTGTLATVTNNGTISTQNTTTTPVATGKTWGGTGTFNLNAASTAQTLVEGTYNNVTVSTTGGAVTIANVTVNGTLHLPNANPTTTTGALATNTNTLFMGPNATNTGVGDVSGIITRNIGITSNTLYTFGHPNTSILLPPVGTLPTSMSIRTVLGSAPAGKPDAILRTYDFIQTGGSGTKAIISAHYLDSELNSNIENRLVDWVIINSPVTLFEQSRSNYSTTQNWVELGNVNVAFFSSAFGNRSLTLANSLIESSVWNGSESTSWTTAANWTPLGTPSDLTKVIIPDGATTPNDPMLNQAVTIGTLTLETGAILNDWTTGSTLNITGSTGAWINKGTFNSGLSTVIFNTTAVNGVVADATIAGSTTFNNITVASGSLLRPLSDNIINIAGTFTKTGSFIGGSVHNTVQYSGTNQIIVVPNGATAAYHNLIISGTGAVVPSTLNVNGNLTTNSIVNFAGTTVVMAGSDEESEFIGGSVNPVFNNLIINKSIGEVDLATNITVSGTLTLTTGLLEIGNYNLTLGATPVAGIFSVTTMIASDGTGVVRRAFTGPGSYMYPIGEKTSDVRYSPITVNITSGTFNNAFVAVNVRDAVHPDNHSIDTQLSRYWNVTQTGITNAVAAITGTYVAGDVEGNGILAAAQLNGTFNSVTNPWIKYADLSGTTLYAENVSLTAGQTSAFTGITSQNPTAVIAGEGTFCAGDVITLTAEVAGGVAPYTYIWSNGLGSASTAAPNTGIVGTTTYTLTVRDANGIVATDTADVIITAAAVAGTLTGDQSICEGFADPIILTGYTGNIIRWERSANPGFTNPTFIASTSAVLSSEEMGNLNASRYFRAVIQSGSCAEVYSNAILVTVSSTTWSNGAWSNNAPTTGVAAIFTSDYIATADIVACSIQVTNSANVIIPSGFDVTLNGRITVTSGTFTLEDNANLVQLTDVENIGNITVIQNGSSLYKLDYTSWSSPVTGQNLFTFSPATLANRFYTYGINGLGNEAYISTDAYANSFTAGKGYLIRMPNEIEGTNAAVYNAGTYSFAFEGEFTGVPNNGTITTPLSTAANRFTMVGNPYPSPINVHAFFDGNEDVLDPSAALYFWRKKNNGLETSYATITKDAYTFNQALGGGQEWDEFFNESDEAQWVINTGQGFFVKTKAGQSNPELQFTNGMRRANSHNNQFFRNAQDNDVKSRYWLNITGNERFAQAAIVYSSTATLGIDYGRDGNVMSEGALALYSLTDENKLSIQARPAFAVSDIVPMGYKAETAGTYTITLHRFDGLFEQGQDIYLKDNLTGLYHDIKDAPYQFSTEQGTFESRFEMVYTSSELGTKTPVISANDVVIYKQDKVLHINSGSALMSEVNIFDIRGRLIYTAKDLNSSVFVTSQLQAEEQVLIVNITTDSGKVSKKVIY